MLIKLKDIVRHRDLQIRELDLNHVSFLETVIEGWDPLLLFRVDGRFYLTDGYHRFAAAERKQLEAVEVEVREGTFADALRAAIEVNASHRGKPLSLKERTHCAELLLKMDPHRANRAIAKMVGLSHPTLETIRKELEARGEIPRVEETLGADGKTRPKQLEKITSSIEEPPDPWGDRVLCPKDAFEVLPQEAPSSYDLVFVDPPYDITKEDWDQFKDPESFLAWTKQWLLLVCPLLKPTGRLYVCFSYQHFLQVLPEMRKVVETASGLYPLTFGTPIIWHHLNTISAAHNQRDYKPTYDFVFYWYGPEAAPLTHDDAYTGDERGAVWNIAVPQSNFHEGKHHKAQKPLELVERIVKAGTRAGDKVLDPFAGSGTTGVACLILGRNFKLIEKKPEYLETIIRRLNDASGRSLGGSEKKRPQTKGKG